MILIEPMKRGLEIVRMFNGLEREQLYFLLKKEYPKRNANTDINRLLRMKLVTAQDDAIIIPGTDTDSDIREAVQILISFWNKNILSYNRGQSPVLLKFSKLMRGFVCDFYVCKTGDLSMLRLEDNTAVIVLAETKNKFQNIKLNCEILIAVKEYGKYLFYKQEEI